MTAEAKKGFSVVGILWFALEFVHLSVSDQNPSTWKLHLSCFEWEIKHDPLGDVNTFTTLQPLRASAASCALYLFFPVLEGSL